MPLLKTVGSLMILAFAYFLSETYRKNRKEETERLEGCVQLIRRMREEISCCLTPCDVIFKEFRNESLEACGFLPLLRRAGSLSQALAQTKERLALPEEAFAVLTEYAERLGEGCREEETDRADAALASLLPICGKERQTSEKETRTARVLLLSGAVMVILWWI